MARKCRLIHKICCYKTSGKRLTLASLATSLYLPLLFSLLLLLLLAFSYTATRYDPTKILKPLRIKMDPSKLISDLQNHPQGSDRVRAATDEKREFVRMFSTRRPKITQPYKKPSRLRKKTGRKAGGKG
ncbi:hypothetical protein ACOMHN_024103 [Nucella lapillus]